MIEIFTKSPIESLIALFILTILYFLENFDRYLIAVSPIPYIDYSSYEYSILVGPAFTIIYTFGGLCFSLIYEEKPGEGSSYKKFGILSLSTFVFSLAFAITAFLTTFWQQVIVRILMGLSQSIITPFSTSIIRNLFPESLSGSAFGIFNTGTYFAFSLSLSLGTYLYDKFGWKAGYLLFGIIGCGCALFIPCLSCINIKVSTEYDRLQSDEIRTQEEKFTLEKSEDSTNPLFLSDQSFDPSPNLQSNPSNLSHFERAKTSFKNILFLYWKQNSFIYVLCLATGIRLGAGYIWSAYTGAFFSDLFSIEDNSISCKYSFNSTISFPDTSIMCGNDYPYCVESGCNSLNEFPWHNKGMSSLNLEEYMSWVPLLGSALGSSVGGFLSDYFIVQYDNCADNKILSTISIRAFISGITSLLALPFVSWSFFLDFPGCYLIYIVSGIMGEVYLSQTLALITHQAIIPKDQIASSVALFMLIITIIGGNFPLIIPVFESIVGFNNNITVQFSAAIPYSPGLEPSEILFQVENTDASKLQYSLLFSMIFCYGTSGILYIIAYLMMVSQRNSIK